MSERAPRIPNFKSANFYDRLGIDEYAAQGEIKEAYRKLAAQFHPDKNVGVHANIKKKHEEHLKLINEAYTSLKKPQARERYDQMTGAAFDRMTVQKRAEREKRFAEREAEAQREREAADKLEEVARRERAAEARHKLATEEEKERQRKELEAARAAAEELTKQEQARAAAAASTPEDVALTPVDTDTASTEDVESNQASVEEDVADEEEDMRVNALWINQQYEQGVSHEDILTTLREQEWSEAEITKMLVKSFEMRQQEEVAGGEPVPDDTGAPKVASEEPVSSAAGAPADKADKDKKPKVRKEIRKRATRSFQQLRDGEKTLDEIEAGLKAEGLSDEDREETLREMFVIKEIEDEKRRRILEAEAAAAAMTDAARRGEPTHSGAPDDVKDTEPAKDGEPAADAPEAGEKYDDDEADFDGLVNWIKEEEARGLSREEIEKQIKEATKLSEGYINNLLAAAYGPKAPDAGPAAGAAASDPIAPVVEPAAPAADPVELPPAADPAEPLDPEEKRQRAIDEELAKFKGSAFENPMPDVEDTPLGWRNKLKSLIKEKLGDAKEKFEWWKSAEEGLIRRNAELDAEGEKISRTEKYFRALGEKYNSLPFKYKVLVGASLGLGTVATAGTLAMALPLLGIAGQRVAGLATMYMKFEKDSHDEAWGKNTEWGKQKALLKAGAYTVILGLTMKEAIQLASETQVAHTMQDKVQTWLSSMYGGGHKVPTATPKWRMPEQIPNDDLPSKVDPSRPMPAQVETPAPGSAVSAPAGAAPGPVPEVGGRPAVAPAAEGAKPAVTPEMTAARAIEVKATPGKGYEYMTKRLWEQLQEKSIDASKVAPDSDLAKLLAADKNSIDKVVHQLATENEFFKKTGESVRISLDSHMSFDSNGNILLTDPNLTNEPTNIAPAEAPETPVYRPDAPVAQTGAEAVANSALPPEPTAVPASQEISSSPGIPTVEAVPSLEAPLIVNKFGVSIPSAEAHIYSDGENLMIYGGTQADQDFKLRAYLDKNPGKTILVGMEGKRVPTELVDGKFKVKGALESSGFLGLFGKSFLPPPGPDEFRQIVD